LEVERIQTPRRYYTSPLPTTHGIGMMGPTTTSMQSQPLTVHSPLPHIVIGGARARVRGVRHLAQHHQVRPRVCPIVRPLVGRLVPNTPRRHLFGRHGRRHGGWGRSGWGMHVSPEWTFWGHMMRCEVEMARPWCSCMFRRDTRTWSEKPWRSHRVLWCAHQEEKMRNSSPVRVDIHRVIAACRLLWNIGDCFSGEKTLTAVVLFVDGNQRSYCSTCMNTGVGWVSERNADLGSEHGDVRPMPFQLDRIRRARRQAELLTDGRGQGRSNMVTNDVRTSYSTGYISRGNKTRNAETPKTGTPKGSKSQFSAGGSFAPPATSAPIPYTPIALLLSLDALHRILCCADAVGRLPQP